MKHKRVSGPASPGENPAKPRPPISPLPTPLKPFHSPEYQRRCVETLETALRRVPAYKDWQRFDPGPSHPVQARYAALPVLTKADVRRHYPHGFLAPECDRDSGLRQGLIEEVTTTGATEDAVPLHWNQAWWNASERASWTLNAHAARAPLGGHREAILTSPLCAGMWSDSGTLPVERRMLDRFLFLNETLNPAAWPSEQLDRMVAEINEFRPVTLEANPGFLARLARHIADGELPVFQPNLIVLTYEFPSRLHLRQIRRAFESPVCSSYGSTETGYVFMECEAGRLHQNVEFCHVDFQPLKPEHGGPMIGRILATTFGNPWFRVVRFNINDLVRLASEPCPCGRREGLTLAAIEGRAKDVTLRADGRAVTVNQLDEAMDAVDGLLGYQLEQSAPGVCQLRLVDGTSRSSSAARAAVEALKNLYGGASAISARLVDSLEPESYGKHRLAKPRLALDLESLLDGRPRGSA